MKLLNERNQVRSVAKRWRSQYGGGTYGADKRNRMVGDELLLLDKETATANDVSEITANNSWVSKNNCHECGNETWDIVQVGEEPDYESYTAGICRNCLVKAINMIDEGT